MDAATPLQSPLDPVFAGHTEIPFAFREQFFHREDLPHGMRLEGVMHRIWYRPRWLRPLFVLLGKLGILVPHVAEGVPTTLTVRPGRSRLDGLLHVWDRTFAFPEPVRFRTTIVYDPRIGQVVDLVGPRDALYMVWIARFHPPGRFTLDTHSIALRLGGRKLWMPRWLWKLLLGTVTFSQVAESMEGDTVRIDLLLVHPIFGKVFGYVGTFRTVRTPKADERAEP
ncbi:MAG TPA: DUF4166 domain-containing protein [Longimicrobium sp.]|nr:DUF4166 domain-containing protein [Longimicrobium sp.]